MNLVELDELVHELPAKALLEADAMLETASDEEIPQILGCCGTALRLQEHYSEALMVLSAAVNWAKDPVVRGDLLLRLGTVYAAVKEEDTALELFLKAQNDHLLGGNLSGVGKSLVDHGWVNLHLGRVKEAEMYFHRALDLLDESENRHRYAAYVNLAHCYQDQPQTALKFLDLAGEIPVPRRLALKRVWIVAKIKAKADSCDVGVFIDLMDHYVEAGFLLDASLAAIDAIRYTDAIVAPEFKDRLLHLAHNLPDSSPAAAALAQLWIAASKGKVAQKLLQNAAAAIKEDRLSRLRTALS